MRGLILSGGAGTRLRPITHTRAKQLVPVANKPILFYGIEAMVEAGITEIGIVVGETADEVVAAVGDGSAFGATVTYLHQEAPLGLAHCVRIARAFLGDDDFVMYLGDNMLEQGLGEFVGRFRDHGAGDLPQAQILLCKVEDATRFGVAEVTAEGRVTRLVEKPSDPPSDLALVGVYLFRPAIHEAVAAIAPSARGELEITDAIQWLIDRGHRVAHDEVDGWWLDTGKKDPLLEANAKVLELLERRIDGSVDDASNVVGRVVVEAGAEIIDSTVRGPAVIGAGARIVRSYVGPHTAVGPGVEVVDSEIEHSVVMDGSRLVGAGRLMDSLVGHGCEVTRPVARPAATRLLLGDDSVVELA